jgi:tRNA(adenine34) deaminase
VALDPTTFDGAWYTAFELAWEAWRAGTIPIGAVVSDTEGNQLCAGRNRIFTRDAPTGQVSGSWLAHAELNALLQLPADGQFDGLTVTSTTEPCLLCAGAIVMSLRGRVIVRYAAEDPIAGGMGVAPLSPQGSRRDLRVHELEQGEWVTLADALNLAESIRRVPEGIVATYYRAHRPELFECARDLESVLRPFLYSDTPFEAIVDAVNGVLIRHPRAGASAGTDGAS